MKMLYRAALLLLAATACAPAMAQYAPFTSAPPPSSVTGSEVLSATQNGRGITVTLGQIAALAGAVSSSATPLNVSAIGRDGSGRVTSFTSSGTAYTVTYDAYGPATIAGGGKTTTVTRTNGAVTGISTQ